MVILQSRQHGDATPNASRAALKGDSNMMFLIGGAVVIILAMVVGFLISEYGIRVRFGVDEPYHCSRTHGTKHEYKIPKIPRWMFHVGRFGGNRHCGSWWITVLGLYLEIQRNG